MFRLTRPWRTQVAHVAGTRPAAMSLRSAVYPGPFQTSSIDCFVRSPRTMSLKQQGRTSPEELMFRFDQGSEQANGRVRGASSTGLGGAGSGRVATATATAGAPAATS